MQRFFFLCLFLVVSNWPKGGFSATTQDKLLVLVISEEVSPRVKYGVDSLSKVLTAFGYTVQLAREPSASKKQLIIGKLGSAVFSQVEVPSSPMVKEGFKLHLTASGANYILAGDDTGVLYGCLELAERIKKAKKLPEQLDDDDHPEMVLRGTAIGVQKPYYLPGRTVYEYPYTPETFPWLYDKQLWVRYLDMLLENRYNSLYLWNGHPFASLVRLKDYPYAVEVDDETFKKNEELFRFVTAEADKRGIWVIQMFYNIIVSKPFAEKHGIKTQDRNRGIQPVIADYTRKSIAAFVEKYPNVGLLITLGEAMEGVGQDDIDWFTKTIIPGVQDGLRHSGTSGEPPIVLRAHDTDAPAVMKAALPLYKNLYTMAKYNGEALTTYTPRGKWAELHRTLSKAAPVHIQNVHILANLEPFRYGSADFIQKSVQAMHRVYHSNGLHLYPQASYWDWPYAADKIDSSGTKRLLQLDRDWVWYKAWARYAWNAERDRDGEKKYWGAQFASHFGLNEQQGEAVLKSYEEMGEIAPKLLRRYGITDGNRQTLSLGMFMTQLINPYRYSLFTLLYESEAPEGEMIIDYAKKEWQQEPHIGETPIQVAHEVEEHGRKAVQAIESIPDQQVKNHAAEFQRIKNDSYCYEALANFYAQKARAAVQVLRYKYSNDVQDLDKALPYLERSVHYFRKLTALTDDAYLYANSMQTKQRKIPIRGIDGHYKKWDEMLPLYEKELAHFKRQIDSLKTNASHGPKVIKPLAAAEVKVLTQGAKPYTVEKGASVFADSREQIQGVAADLRGLQGVQFSKAAQQAAGTKLEFEAKEPVKVLVGFFREPKGAFGTTPKQHGYAPEPDLEHDASANDYGQSDVMIANALALEGYPSAQVHAYFFEAGKQQLTLPKGQCMILGFIKGNQPFKNYDAEVGIPPEDRNIDWLFE